MLTPKCPGLPTRNALRRGVEQRCIYYTINSPSYNVPHNVAFRALDRVTIKSQTVAGGWVYHLCMVERTASCRPSTGHLPTENNGEMTIEPHDTNIDGHRVYTWSPGDVFGTPCRRTLGLYRIVMDSLFTANSSFYWLTVNPVFTQ